MARVDNPDDQYTVNAILAASYFTILRRIPELGTNDAAIISERIAYDESVERILDEDGRAWLHLARAAMRMMEE